MKTIRAYFRQTTLLFLALATTSCALIEWIDPIYEETAGVSKPGAWVDSPGVPLGLLSTNAVIKSAILYPNAYNSFGPSVSIAYATDDEVAVHSLQSDQFTALGSESLPGGSTISGMSASISTHGTFVAIDVHDGSGNISAELYKVADFSGSWDEYTISNGTDSLDSTVFSSNFVNLVSSDTSSASDAIRCDAQEAALPKQPMNLQLPGSYNGTKTKIIRYSANYAVVLFINATNQLAGYYFSLASTCLVGTAITAFTGDLGSAFIESYDVQVNPNTGKGLFAGIDLADSPILASLESSMPTTNVITNSVSTDGLPEPLTEIALVITDNVPYLAIYGAGTNYHVKVYTPQAGGSWSQLGSDISPDAIVPGTLSIGLDDDGNPMVAFGDTTQSDRLRVKVYQ